MVRLATNYLPGKITLSVVSHGQDALLSEFLRDVASYAFDSLHRLIITHNLPTAAASFYVEKKLDSRCLIIRNVKPRGFSANHNTAFSQCETEWFAIANPDIRLDSDVLGELASRALPQDAALAPGLVEPRLGAVASNRGLITPFEIFRRRMNGGYRQDEIVWLPGAFMLLRSKALREIGGFDERFHLYAEDFDLCARLRLAGWNLHYVPELKVIHAAQRSSHYRWRYLRWHVTSLLKLWTTPSFWRYRALLEEEAARHTAQRTR
jgi:GT2 family glycosyltransferase